MEAEELRTKRLILRKLTPETFDYIYTALSETKQIEYLRLKTKQELEVERKKYEQ